MSRVPGIIILTFALLSGSLSPGLSQKSYQLLGLSKKEYKNIRKAVRKTPFAKKAGTFILDDKNRFSLANLDTVTELYGYPLPSAEAIDIANDSLPDFIADILKTNYFVDIRGDEMVSFYGLDSVGRKLSAKPYFNNSDLLEGILNHDYVFSTNIDITAWASKNRPDKNLRQQLDKKLIEHIARADSPEVNNSNPELKTLYRNWVIQVYSSNKEIYNLRSSGRNPDITMVHPPDNNWLSNLISDQIKAGGFSEAGRRTKLVRGNARMFDIDTAIWQSVDTLVTSAIQQKAMPGCQLLVAKNGYVILDKAYGYQTYDSLRLVKRQTIYDLASLTKVLATTQALMLLYDEGKFDPGEKLSTYLPYLDRTNKEDITGTEVLSHQANLYLYYPFWRKALEDFNLLKMTGSVRAGRNLGIEPWVGDSIVSWAARSELLSERVDTVTRRQYFYSDIGFFFLKDVVEKQSGNSLDRFLTERLYEPTGTDLIFNPLLTYPDSMIAPTEFDRVLRNELVLGYVHDRNAALLGGVAGQAGLFGNAENIAKLMQIHLDQGNFKGKQIFSPASITEFTTRHFENNRRGLGWDMPGTEIDGPVSTYASKETFGHTGFTGGMIWADPKENLIFVFLSNRVYPEADNNKLIEMNIRTRIQDLIYESLGYH